MKTDTNILHCESPEAALGCLCNGFVEAAAGELRFDRVEANDIPPACRGLLVHDGHMTEALESFYGGPMDLRVIRERLLGDDYRREIVLALKGGGQIVEYGVVRMDLACTSEEVRGEIVARERPLGEILIRHDVLRRIQPQWYLRFAADSKLLKDRFGGHLERQAFGRIGVIHCNGQPAIELLEIVIGKGAGGAGADANRQAAH